MTSDTHVDPAPAVAIYVAPTDDKSVKVSKQKKSRTPKKPRAASTKAAAAHPSYFQMIVEAIAALKERGGSSQPAIAKYIEGKYKTGLPPNFKKLLSVHLKRAVQRGQLVQVKHSFKLSESQKKKPATAKVVKPETPGRKPRAGRPKGSKNKVAKSPKPKVTKTKKTTKARTPRATTKTKVAKVPAEKKVTAPKKRATPKKTATPKKRGAPKKRTTPKKVGSKKPKSIMSKVKKTPIAKKLKKL